MRIRLTSEEVAQCREFAKNTQAVTQAIEFGQTDTAPRSKEEIAADICVGKMGEVAVSRFLRERWRLHCPVDFGIYPPGECDDNDIQIKAWSIDVKTTTGGRWLLFDADKVRMRARQGKIPDAVIGCRADGDYITIAGAISMAALIRSETLKKGSCLPGTSCRLQAENYAVPLERLNSKWDEIVRQMLTTVPYRIIVVEGSRWT